MRCARFVCLFAILISMLVLAQSSRAPLGNQRNGLPIARETHLALPPSLSQMPQGARFAQRRNGRAKAVVRGLATSQVPGLSFAPAVDYASGGYPADSVAVADVNGDGKPDLVVANAGGSTVGVLLGKGDGTFQTAVTYGSGGVNPYSVAVADVNGDGKPDLLVTNEAGPDGAFPGVVGVLLGNGDGTFQSAVTGGDIGYESLSIVIADVNGDSKPDLVVSSACVDAYKCNGGVVYVLLGNGDGTFQASMKYSSGGLGADSVAVADVNGDDKLDVLVATSCSGSGCVGVLLGNGDGTFQSAVTYGSGGGAGAVAVADVNGDDKLDVLVATSCSGSGCVGVLLGNGDGTFQSAVTYGSGGQGPASVAVADVNGDGKPDLLVANGNSNTVGVLLGNGDGAFQTAMTYGSGGNEPVSIAVADVNADGKPDLIVANISCASSGACNSGVAGVLINTSLNPTTTTLTSSQNPSSFGQTVTFTATVTAQENFYKVPPTGTVSFYDGTTNIGNSNLNNSGVATLTTSTLVVGTHTMTATYNGDTNSEPSTSPVLYQVVQGAIVVLSPNALNFGNQTVGITSSPQNVTLRNTGNIILTITSIGIGGVNSGDFAQTNDCGTSVAANGSCNIAVTFTPTTTGTRNAAATIVDNAPDSPQSVPLTGVGVLPAVTFSPTSLNFGNQGVGTTSSPQATTLTNTGAGVLTIASIGIKGTNRGSFAQTNNCPASVPPNGSCQISVTFTPTNTGTRNAAVSVADNAPGSPQLAPLIGVGTPPGVTFSPTNLIFSDQVVFTTSPVQQLTLTNTGAGVLKINHISVTGPFSQANNCPSSVGPGVKCTISVRFHPTNKGVQNGAVSVTDNALGSPQKVPLTGTGTFVQLVPTKLTFGTQPVGTRSLARKITLTNKSSSTVRITGIPITGTDAGDFAETNTCGESLASGASCFIKVTFKPLAKGKRTAIVSVYDNGGGSPQQAILTGTGT